MNRNILLFLFFTLVVALFSSCDENRIFEAYKTIPDAKWNKDSLLVFNVPVTDTIQSQNLLINVRNTTSYGYSNLWLFIEIVQPGGRAVKDTFEITLAKPSGKWLGEGFGGIKTRQVMYRRNINLPESGDYKVIIQHGMREKVLEGIHDIGIRIEKASSEN